MRIQKSVTVPHAGDSGNVLQGLVGSIVRDPSGIDFAAVADDGGDGTISASFLIDTESVLINGGIQTSTANGVGPTDPENVIFRNEAAPAGSILNLTFFNAEPVNDVVVRYWVNINPV